MSTTLLATLAFARREPLPARRDLLRIAAYGVLWLAVYNVVLNEAERRVDAGTAAMLVNVGPDADRFARGARAARRLPATLLGGLAIAFAGCVVIAAATSEGVS